MVFITEANLTNYLADVFNPQAAPSPFQAFLTVLLSAVSLLLTAPLSPFVAWIYTVVLSMILFAAPAALVWARKYKK